MNQQFIRNFCIIAHIDHGKSTLADRLLEATGTVSSRGGHKELVLDDMDLERERGITIKASAVKMNYIAKDGNEYVLNLIDTPGHVDFTFEVSKSLGACEGALLLVDAAQGVEAQTVANLYLALEYQLTIIPVINKIDLANARPDEVKQQIVDVLKVNPDSIILASAKEGIGTEDILERIVKDIPPPKGNSSNPLQALIFDSSYDIYKGVIVYIRVFNGRIASGTEIVTMGNQKSYQVQEVGTFKPQMVTLDNLECGDVGYLAANIREPKDIINGDTITELKHPASAPLRGYKKMRSMVFSGVYPVNAKDFPALKEAIEKLQLSDASFVYEPESSASLGLGFRCGFLGLLHMEIVQERLEREYDLNLVITTPSVLYKVRKKDGQLLEIDNPTKLPPPAEIHQMQEPIVSASVIVPLVDMSEVMDFVKTRRGRYISTEYIGTDRIKIIYEIPLSEIIVDFYDKLKSMTKGYGSLDYEFKSYQPSNLVRLDILLNGKPCDALSNIIHKEKAYAKGRLLVEKLKELIPRQLFEVAVQAAIGGQIIARETIRPLGKHVTGKCYGGDITRKRKLWEIQKKGKKRMKQFGNVEIPQEAFMAVLKI